MLFRSGDRYPSPGVASTDSTTACMTDANGDGYGDDTPDAGVTAGTDCDDASRSTSPAATEITADGIDNDCDDTELCFVDADGDGYTDRASTVVSADLDCRDSGEAGLSAGVGECDDADAAINPGESEGVGDEIDQNCDDVEVCYADVDGDGYTSGNTTNSSDLDCRDAGEALSTAATGDCDDGDATLNPAATEVAGDGVDTDCDGAEICYVDADEDGYTDGSTTLISRDDDCGDPGEALATEPTGECDDGDATVHPDATEGIGDGIDQDCDGGETCYADADADGYSDQVTTVVSSDTDCADSGEATDSAAGGECDDADASVSPGVDEIPGDGVDQDCDGREDCYVDGDADGWTDGTTSSSADADCADAGEAGADAGTGDCDDADATVFPGAEDTWYDGVDADCDEADDYDADGDGRASDAYFGDDCDDTDATIGPDAEELPGDELDQDCDGKELCYRDADLDHYPDTTTVESDDLDCADLGETTDALETDCDDEDEGVHPGATDVPDDDIDQDCDGADAGSGADPDTDDTGEPKDEPGCGCASTPDAGASALLVGLGLLVVRRRRPTRSEPRPTLAAGDR